jgi:phosphoenolpyruvate carboxykinase (ATP)
MRKNELNKYGITGVTEVLYNPTYEVLYNEETRPELEGFDRGQVTELGAINVMTGVYTGRSPKDKYIVMDAKSKDTIWWDTPEYPNDNRALSEENWKILKDIAVKQLSGKRLFVVDGFCGTHKETRMKIRFIMEVAWQAHFVTNMFIRPKNQEEFDQEPDFVVYCAAKAKVDNYKEMGLRTETAVAFNVSSKEQVIINTWYGGEMKKGIFSMMNYYLPLQGVASMHCSANTDLDGKNTAIFFGLSGTGKTTLSTDPKVFQIVSPFVDTVGENPTVLQKALSESLIT